MLIKSKVINSTRLPHTEDTKNNLLWLSFDMSRFMKKDTFILKHPSVFDTITEEIFALAKIYPELRLSIFKNDGNVFLQLIKDGKEIYNQATDAIYRVEISVEANEDINKVLKEFEHKLLPNDPTPVKSNLPGFFKTAKAS